MEVNLLVNIASQVLPEMQPLGEISFYNEKSTVGDLHILNGCTYSRVTIEALYNLGHSMDYTLRFPALGKSMTEILQHLKLQEDGISPRCPVQQRRKKKIRQQNHQTNKKRYKHRQQYLDQYIKSVSS